MLHLAYTYVASVCFKYFKCFERMLQVFDLDVAKVDLVLHMMQWLYTCIASVCFKYFSCFKFMLQIFCLDVAYVPVATHMLQVCFPNI